MTDRMIEAMCNDYSKVVSGSFRDDILKPGTNYYQNFNMDFKVIDEIRKGE